MAATVIAATAAGIIQGMVTGEVDTAATVMGGAATPIMAEATAVHITEVVASRVVTEEAGSLVAVDTEAGGTVRKLVQEQPLLTMLSVLACHAAELANDVDSCKTQLTVSTGQVMRTLPLVFRLTESLGIG
jgi:hypothetical protein